MSLTLSHQSALDVIRILRSSGVGIRDLTPTRLVYPTTWVGKYWGSRSFASEAWQWPVPTRTRPLHVLVPGGGKRIRSSLMCAHTVWCDLPSHSVLWLDEHSSIVCPELLFLQMAEVFPFPMLVMLGYELCGHFSRNPEDPLRGEVMDGIPAITTQEDIARHLASFTHVPGLAEAKRALHYISNRAMSAPEAVIATMYSLPPSESGYGLGSVVLNERVGLDDLSDGETHGNRYPDIMLSFAPVGINYEGYEHLDLEGLVAAAQRAVFVDAESRASAVSEVRDKLKEIRAKVVDDGLRNRQLAAQGRIVLTATKEDLFELGGLDGLTLQLLSCANRVFGADVAEYVEIINSTDLARDRQELLDLLLPHGFSRGVSYGKM